MTNLRKLVSQSSSSISTASESAVPQAPQSAATPHPTGARLALAASICVLANSIMVLVGWRLGIEGLMTVLPNYVRMKPNTAVGLGLTAVALMAEFFTERLLWRMVPATAFLLIGAATAFEYQSDLALGIDELLFQDPIQSLHPGRMAPITVANLLILGTALLLRASRHTRSAGVVLAFLVVLSSTFAIVGYAYGVPILYGSDRYTAMALHTGVSFLFLSLATLSIDPTESLGKLFRSNGSGGLLVRRLVPVAVIAPLFLGFIFTKPQFNFNHLGLAVALTVVACVVLLFGMILSLAHTMEKRDAEIDLARLDSLLDPLTGAFNRRQFDLQIEKEIARSRRDGQPFSLILVDADFFKKLNDSHGHLYGDAVLRSIVETGNRVVRASDFFCRYGGEEFAVIAPGADELVAMDLAERLRRAVSSLNLGGAEGGVTISAGVTQFLKSDTSGSDLIRRADLALYQAKSSGRNCVRATLEVSGVVAGATGTKARVLDWPAAM